jgi:hypothetical protein
MQCKQVHLEDLKFDDAAGSVTALFAPFGVVDKQNDLTLPGAFGEQNTIIGAYGHRSWDGSLPIGKGRIFEGAAGGILEGKFNLASIAGRETYLTIKHLEDLQEWSYSLENVVSEMQTINGKSVRVISAVTVPEVSPVLMGVGRGTRTLALKSCQHCTTGCKRLAGGECCVKDEDWQEEFSGRSGIEREAARFKELSETFARPFPYVSVKDAEVAYDVRVAAGVAFEKALAVLGLPPTVTLQWVLAETPEIKEELERGESDRKLYLLRRPLKGWTRDNTDTIFVRADLEPREAALVTVHELRHLCQRDVPPAAHEQDAQDFAASFVADHIDYGRL